LERHGIRPAGFWTVQIGESNNDLYYLLAWESLAEREKKWTAFMTDPAWISARAESERDGQIIASIKSMILQPTAFSTVKSRRLGQAERRPNTRPSRPVGSR
jgi:hypothetical protein